MGHCFVKSTTKFVFMFGGEAVFWKSCKQTVIAKSTMEVDFTAPDSTYSEAEWLKDIISEFLIMPRPVHLIYIHTEICHWVTEVS